MGPIVMDLGLMSVKLCAILWFMDRQQLSAKFEQTIEAYQRGDIDMSAVARYADVSVYHLMVELEKRDITPPSRNREICRWPQNSRRNLRRQSSPA